MHLIFALAVAENYFEITAAKLLHNLTANAARIAKVLVFAVFVFTDYRNSFEIVFTLADCLKKSCSLGTVGSGKRRIFDVTTDINFARFSK